jgi:hypothetical protein
MGNKYSYSCDPSACRQPPGPTGSCRVDLQHLDLPHATCYDASNATTACPKAVGFDGPGDKAGAFAFTTSKSACATLGGDFTLPPPPLHPTSLQTCFATPTTGCMAALAPHGVTGPGQWIVYNDGMSTTVPGLPVLDNFSVYQCTASKCALTQTAPSEGDQPSGCPADNHTGAVSAAKCTTGK